MPISQGIRAGAAYVELYAKDNRLVRGLDRAAKRLKAFGASIRNAGLKMTALGAGMITPMLAATKTFNSMGDKVSKMSERTGFSVESLSELGFAAEQSGSNIETLEAGIRRMQRSISDAGRDLKTAKDALASLGLTFENLQDLSPEEQFKTLAERLSQVEDPTKRAALAMEIFGRGGTALLPMMSEGVAGMEALQRQARSLGLTISTKDAKAAVELTDLFNILWRVVKQGVFAVGAALAPALKQVAQWLTKVFVQAGAWVKENQTLVVGILKVAAVITGAGIALIIFGTAVSALGSAIGGIATVITLVAKGFGLLGSILAWLVSPIGLVIAAVAALAGYLLYATGAGAKALSWLSGKFMQLKDDALKAYQGIGDALAAGDIALAAKILWLTLKMEWQRGVKVLLSLWLKVKHFALDVWYAILAGWEIAVHGITVALIEGIAAMKQAIATFWSWWRKGQEGLASWLAKQWVKLKAQFDDTIDVEASLKYLDEQRQMEFEKVDRETESRKREIEQQRKASREQAAVQHENDLAAIGRKSLDLADEYDRKMKESADAIAKAREEWRQAIAEARQKREAKETDEGPGKLKDPRDLLDKLQAKLAGLGDTLAEKLSVQGTFNATALAGLVGGTVADRTMKASEETARNTRKLRDLDEDNALVFE